MGARYPGDVERVELRVRTLHETSNWRVIPDWSKVFNTGNRTAVLTPLMAKCWYDVRPVDVLFGWTPGRLGR